MWRLPDGREIKNPDAGRTFQIGNVVHPELNLLLWDDTELASQGIFRVVRQGYDDRIHKCTGYTEATAGQTITCTPVVVDKETLQDAKGRLKRHMKEQYKLLLQIAKNEIDYLTELEPTNTTDLTTWNQYLTDLKYAAENTVKPAFIALSTLQEVADFDWGSMLPEMPQT